LSNIVGGQFLTVAYWNGGEGGEARDAGQGGRETGMRGREKEGERPVEERRKGTEGELEGRREQKVSWRFKVDGA
jgi:hypothetical protein